jgi:hypothetical protein
LRHEIAKTVEDSRKGGKREVVKKLEIKKSRILKSGKLIEMTTKH